MTEFEYVVGDSFEGGPIELGKYIQAILAEGGSFDYTGNIVTITALPNAPQPKAEIPLNADPVGTPDVFIEAILEVPEEEPEAPKPVRKPRTPKTTPTEE